MSTQKRDPVADFLEEQRALDEADLMENLRLDADRRMRELKSQVPDGRHDRGLHGNPPRAIPGAAEERWPGDYPDDIGGWRNA